MLPSLESLIPLLRNAAREELLPRFNGIRTELKSDGSLLTEADLAMDRRLREELAEHWPAIAFLSEEMEQAEQELLLSEAEQPLWCLDPLDGTTNFAAGVPLFAVSLALLIGGRVELGVIYDPSRDEAFSARAGVGAWLNGESLTERRFRLPLKRAVAIVDFKRLPAGLGARILEQRPFASQRNFGSCAIEWAWIAAGRGHVHLHGGQKLWDLAAGSLILHEAGGASCTLDGEPVFHPTLAPRSVVSSADTELLDEWRQWIGVAGPN